MDVKINQVILHILMPAHRNRCFRTGRWSWMLTFMNIFPSALKKAFASDDSKTAAFCRIPPFCRRCSTTMTLLTFRAVLQV